MASKREQELLLEVETLKNKLDHAEKWMTRQVEETSPIKGKIFERLHPKKGVYDLIVNVIDKFRKIRIFRHRYTLWELWLKRIEAFFVGAAIILFWRGIWNLADNFLFVGEPIKSSFASLALGMGILLLSKNFVNQFIDDAVEEADEYE
jgi:Fuseless